MSYKYRRKRPPISGINWIIQGPLQGQEVKRAILGSSE